MEARKAHHRFRDKDGDFVSCLRLYRACKDAPDRAKFCGKNYLDERAMAEILNVTEQLSQIVSALGVPILSGGPAEDYLCAVARGLIQFVCVREGEMYRSLTADKIQIHPGSVMFKTDPKYIVAGEIVRTTRTYAMSVSPLSPEALEKISPRLIEAFRGRSGGGRRKGDGGEAPAEGRIKRARDFSNNIRIGERVFEVKTFKGKKEVILPWEELRKLEEELGTEGLARIRHNWPGLRGTVAFGDGCTLLAGEKLSLILTLLPSLSIFGGKPPEAWRKTRGLNSREKLGELLEVLPELLSPAIWKPGKKELGFLCLHSGGDGNYRLGCSRGFHTGLNESLASVETLIDELGEEIDLEKRHIVNQCYRRLSDYLG
jgi:hypothetical protein